MIVHDSIAVDGFRSGYTVAPVVQGEEIRLGDIGEPVVDIFEALTAQDRPYKPAMPVEKAHEILRAEAKFGGLQPEIVEFFIEERIADTLPESERKRFTLTSEQILALA